MKHKVCIGIPLYNYGRFVEEAIESALAQGEAYHVLIVDDCSTDGSRDILKKYSDHPRCSVVYNEENLGAVANFNKAFHESDCEYYLQLAADDYLLPDSLNTLLDVLETHHDVGFVYGRYIIVDEDSNFVKNVDHPGYYPCDYRGGRNELADLFIHDLYINVGATLYRRSVLEEHGFFDETLKINSEERFFRSTDYDISLRMAVKGVKAAFVNQNISAFRVHDEQASVGGDFVEKGIQFQEHLALLERYIVDDNYPMFMGKELEIVNTFFGKLEYFKAYSKQVETVLPPLVERIETIYQKLLNYHEFTQKSLTHELTTQTPLVSVVIPTKDRPHLIVNALNSLLSQTYTNWEVVVVNDGGESISSIVESLLPADKFQCLELENNKGQSHARNLGLSVSNGEVICFLDDDDLYKPQHLKTLIDAILTGHDFVYSHAEVLKKDESGESVSKGIAYFHLPYSPSRLLVENYIPINTYAVKASVLKQSGLFDETLDCLEDWEFLIRVNGYCDFYRLDTVTVIVNQGSEGSVTDNSRARFYDVFQRVYESYPVDDPALLEAREERLSTLNVVPEPAPKKNKQYGSIFTEALTLYEQIGESLPSTVKRILNQKKYKHVSDAEKLETVLDCTNYLVTEALEQVDYLEGKTLDAEVTTSLYEAYMLYTEVIELVKQSAITGKARTQLREIIETNDYQAWIKQHELKPVDLDILQERMDKHWTILPRFTLLTIVNVEHIPLLADTIESLAGQMLDRWQLIVFSDVDAPDAIFEELSCLTWHMVNEDQDVIDVINDEIKRFPSSEWVSFIDAGVQYPVEALMKLADAINLNPEVSFIYSDDDLYDTKGVRYKPRFKPNFNLDLLRSIPYMGYGWMSAEPLSKLGGLEQRPFAENYDLALRWVDAYGKDSFFHVTDVLMHIPDTMPPTVNEACVDALNAHLKRTEQNAVVRLNEEKTSLVTTYIHQDTPKVSILIPTKDKLEFLQPCIESVIEKTLYPNYEIVVIDNQSQEPETHDYYARLLEQNRSNVKVLYYDKPFNFSDMNNWAAEQMDGDFLLLLNNDTEIVHADWLSLMVMHGQREEVGIVGARLFYPSSGRCQHTGVILGLSDIADHTYLDMLTVHDSSYMDRASLVQNLSVVTAAVMLVKKSVYDALGGMDKDNLAVLFNDVDLCIRANELGYSVVYTPEAMAVHHGSTSVGEADMMKSFYFDWDAYAKKMSRSVSERRHMIQRWSNWLANDPAYNPNLSIRYRNYNIELNAPLVWERRYSLRTKCYGVPLTGGSGEYRLRQPFDALSGAGIAQCLYGTSLLAVTEHLRLEPDVVVAQNAFNENDIHLFQLYKEFRPATKIVFLLDDLVQSVPEKSAQYKIFKGHYRDIIRRLRRALALCDRLIVSTSPLLDVCEDMIDDIVTIPNRLSSEIWSGLSVPVNEGNKPRVGWAGAQQHQGDLELIFEVVKETAEEIDWIFMGMCPDEILPFVKESHDFVPLDEYPQKLASLALDLAIAPLEMNEFNEAKSNLRLLEYGVLGWPVICTDIYPYQTNNPPVTRVVNTKEAWLEAIRTALANPEQTKQAGDALKEWVLAHYILEDHLDEWAEALYVEKLPEGQ